MQDRINDNALFVFGKRLYQEWLVDQHSKVEAQRLLYMRLYQSQLRAELYQGLQDALNNDTAVPAGRLILLAPTFIGGQRHMHQLYQDSMAKVRCFGKPDLFITMTCNPKWQEITDELKPRESANDRPDLVTRVCRMKLNALLKDLLTRNVLGKVVADIHAQVESLDESDLNASRLIVTEAATGLQGILILGPIP
eukprot:jgi/Chrzof1/15266/UNPLg00663.t1